MVYSDILVRATKLAFVSKESADYFIAAIVECLNLVSDGVFQVGSNWLVSKLSSIWFVRMVWVLNFYDEAFNAFLLQTFACISYISRLFVSCVFRLVFWSGIPS